MPLPSSSLARLATVAALFSGAFAALPAHALYKVVGPDGKVTYTDRPPLTTENKVQSVNATTGATAGGSTLPFELRQVAQRYPVTLYSANNCAPCDSARQALRQRGVPFSERTVSTKADQDALQSRTGKLDLPAVAIGSQVTTGYDERELAGYLDAAGYPKRSVLPSSYAAPAATPLAGPAPAPAPARGAAEPTTAPAPVASPTPAPAPDPSGIKF